MKKLILIALLGLCNILSAIEDIIVILPSADILKERLEKLGFKDFLEQTHLHQKLGNKRKYTLEISWATSQAVYDYNENYFVHQLHIDMQNARVETQMQEHRSLILEALLEDHPKAIEDLKALKILNPAAAYNNFPKK